MPPTGSNIIDLLCDNCNEYGPNEVLEVIPGNDMIPTNEPNGSQVTEMPEEEKFNYITAKCLNCEYINRYVQMTIESI